MHLVGDREGLLPQCSAGNLELRRLHLKRTWQLTACLLQIINGSLPTGSTISITTRFKGSKVHSNNPKGERYNQNTKRKQGMRENRSMSTSDR